MTIMKLKVGDKVYKVHYEKIISIHTIERVTKTLAISKNVRFRLDYDKFGVEEYGRDSWGSYSYHIESEELKGRLERQKMLSIIKDFDFNKLENGKLLKILDVIKS